VEVSTSADIFLVLLGGFDGRDRKSDEELTDDPDRVDLVVPPA
jgi:hypothetical protein